MSDNNIGGDVAKSVTSHVKNLLAEALRARLSEQENKGEDSKDSSKVGDGEANHGLNPPASNQLNPASKNLAVDKIEEALGNNSRIGIVDVRNA